jgi:hypothetical protein
MRAGSVMPWSPEQQRRVRRSALLWALIAAGFYLGFILLTLVRGAQ